MGKRSEESAAIRPGALILVVLPDIVDDFAVIRERARGFKRNIAAQITEVADRCRDGSRERQILRTCNLAMKRHAVGPFFIVPDDQPVLQYFRMTARNRGDL